jgi:hypothetical protein
MLRPPPEALLNGSNRIGLALKQRRKRLKKESLFLK